MALMPFILIAKIIRAVWSTLRTFALLNKFDSFVF